MAKAKKHPAETDPRFPSGPWTGFFLQRAIPGKHRMELILAFSQNQIEGEGRDWVGNFILRGGYSLYDGKCYWTKRYLGKHDVFYKGYNEGKGIWGTWEISSAEFEYQQGGFHIWPEGMEDPTGSHLTEAAELPVKAPDQVPAQEPVVAPVGSKSART
jgi:hypothetical protein